MKKLLSILSLVLLLTACSSVKRNQKLLAKGNYEKAIDLAVKKLQKEGFIRYCIIKQFSLNFVDKNSKVFIEVRVVKPLNNLGLFSSIKSRTNLKKYNNSQNLGLIFKSNSNTQNSLIKSFGEIFLILK